MIDRVWFVLPGLDHVRVSTVLGALAVFAVIVTLRRRPLLAGLAVLGWLSAYEIVFNAAGVVFERWPLNTWDFVAATLLGWVVAAWLGGIRPALPLVVVCAAAMAAWLATGFHSNVPTGRPWSLEGEILNEISKTALGAAYLVGALRLTAKQEHLAIRYFQPMRRASEAPPA